GLWHSGTFPNGSSFSFTFNVPAGNYSYFCTPHFTLGMVGGITVAAGNNPPSVSIFSPINGATFPAGTNIIIQASASDSDGTVARVDFSSNGNLIGSAFAQPYTVTLSNVGA